MINHERIYMMVIYKGRMYRIDRQDNKTGKLVLRNPEGHEVTVDQKEVRPIACRHLKVAGPGVKTLHYGRWVDAEGHCYDCNRKVK